MFCVDQILLFHLFRLGTQQSKNSPKKSLLSDFLKLPIIRKNKNKPNKLKDINIPGGGQMDIRSNSASASASSGGGEPFVNEGYLRWEKARAEWRNKGKASASRGILVSQSAAASAGRALPLQGRSSPVHAETPSLIV